MRRTFAIKAEVSDPWAETFAFGAQKTMYGSKHATDYAKARAKFGRGEIRLLRQDGSVESVIGI
jgi:hypothetical protein